jgi:hypothetical protein
MYDRGQQRATRGPHVALETFLWGPSHDLGIDQCEKDKSFLLLRKIDIFFYIYIYTHTHII